MRIPTLAITISLLFWGCSSSEKKSAKKSGQQTSVEQSETNQSSEVVVVEPYSSSADTSGLAMFTGQLNYTGNEPFAVPSLIVEGDQSYKLTADSTFMTKTFSSLNGKTVTIFGKVKSSEPSDLLEVHYYELREN